MNMDMSWGWVLISYYMLCVLKAGKLNSHSNSVNKTHSNSHLNRKNLSNWGEFGEVFVDTSFAVIPIYGYILSSNSNMVIWPNKKCLVTNIKKYFFNNKKEIDKKKKLNILRTIFLCVCPNIFDLVLWPWKNSSFTDTSFAVIPIYGYILSSINQSRWSLYLVIQEI